MGQKTAPKKQGLYDPDYEHDACGIGFVADIKGNRTHDTVSKSLQILLNLAHRGGLGAETNTGDGAGILTQLPHEFFKAECLELGFVLPKPGQYGVGMLFLSHNPTKQIFIKYHLEKIIKNEGQTLLGWRDVPFNDVSLGKTSRDCMPFICQVFIGRSADIKSDDDFERKLYIIRKSAENAAIEDREYFYIPSLSCRTIVYKGMLTAPQVEEFYTDLANPLYKSAIGLVHSRYSTNTFPSWERAHPNRYLVHNGEINTIRGNVNWTSAHQKLLKSNVFGKDLNKLFPIINSSGSDSAMFDNCLEFLNIAGRSLAHSAIMMIPEPWSKNDSMSDEKKAFYEFHSCVMEAWDGPAAMAFTDGVQVGALLDRNGLRPARYCVTKDGMVVLASEVGVLPIEPANILHNGRLHPGKMLLIDTKEGRIIDDDEIKNKLTSEHPYRQWLDKYLVPLEQLPESGLVPGTNFNTLLKRQQTFGYTNEDIKMVISPMASDGMESTGSMGTDTPLAVLSDKPQLLYDYFKQLFAQVTNPPIDVIREEIVTGPETYIGPKKNILNPEPQTCHRIRLNAPVINNNELAKLRRLRGSDFSSVTIPIIFDINEGTGGLEKAMKELFETADAAIEKGHHLLILSDRNIDETHVPIPALLAVSGLHQHLTKENTRPLVNIILESGEPRETHHFAALIGFGASAINPYLAFETIDDMIDKDYLKGYKYNTCVDNYIKASTKGIIKILSKMGISTIQSYRGAQIFEALGLSKKLIDRYFTSTTSRIGGIGLEDVALESIKRHQMAFNQRIEESELESGSFYKWRHDGEFHLYNPETIYKLQCACRNGDYKTFKEYSCLLNNSSERLSTIRGLLKFKDGLKSVPVSEVESVEDICKRFKTGAMSYGSISKEAHECLAIAMNRIGGKSNTGEGGEDPARFIPMANGDSKCSAIKQVASGRFGVTSEYLVNAIEIQIKMAQGAKPGEGGQLPGGKVYPWIAQVRHSTPGVGLISPPPHHDIYSIEDLAELIHDLKNANQNARISVKLVSEVGVGTVAAGVAKGLADVVLISGYDGGTGASPRTSIRHAGLPWELGLAETHQTLLLNNLRNRIVVEADGKLMTGRDVVIAALLGAEEFGFATAPLVTLGCVMMRVCNLDTCPVGVATQNPALRKKFCGDPDHVVNFMHFIASEMREIMAELGFRTVNEMIGHTEILEQDKSIDNYKIKDLDLSEILYKPSVPRETVQYCTMKQDHKLDEVLDNTKLMEICKPALEKATPVYAHLEIHNTDRVAGTIIGSEVTKRYGSKGLPEDTIKLHFEGSAGQSFGAFIPNGLTLTLEGESNDYIGKGLSGGKIVVFPNKESTFVAKENIIIGNVALYGATSGQAYICGVAGERFCVRNSGATAVVEGIGDHGCEYMTGGLVINIGETGRNFAAGMSGGIAYVLDRDDSLKVKCNKDMAELYPLSETADIQAVREQLEKHMKLTGSKNAGDILKNWDKYVSKFFKVIPREYKRMLQLIEAAKAKGLTGDEALLSAFNKSLKKKQ